eukprot:12894-Heterococcus_DN1.PRE.1
MSLAPRSWADKDGDMDFKHEDGGKKRNRLQSDAAAAVNAVKLPEAKKQDLGKTRVRRSNFGGGGLTTATTPRGDSAGQMGVVYGKQSQEQWRGEGSQGPTRNQPKRKLGLAARSSSSSTQPMTDHHASATSNQSSRQKSSDGSQNNRQQPTKPQLQLHTGSVSSGRTASAASAAAATSAAAAVTAAASGTTRKHPVNAATLAAAKQKASHTAQQLNSQSTTQSQEQPAVQRKNASQKRKQQKAESPLPIYKPRASTSRSKKRASVINVEGSSAAQALEIGDSSDDDGGVEAVIELTQSQPEADKQSNGRHKHSKQQGTPTKSSKSDNGKPGSPWVLDLTAVSFGTMVYDQPGKMKLKSWSASPILEINIAGVRAPYTIDLASVRTYRRYKTCSHEIDTGCIVLEVSSDSGIAKALGTKCLQPHMADTAIATVAKPTAIVPGASLKAVRALEAPAPPEIGRRYIVLYLRASDMTEYINGTSDAAAVNIDDDGSGSAAAAAAAASSSASQDASNDSSSQEEQRSMEITLQSALQIAAKDKLSVNHMTDSSSIDQQFCSALIRQRDEKAKA